MRFTWDVMGLWTRHFGMVYRHSRHYQHRARATRTAFSEATHDALTCIAMRRRSHRMWREEFGDD